MAIINGVIYCDSPGDQYIQGKNECSFKPSATKRAFFWKKGEVIDNPSVNLSDLTYWESKIQDGTLVPIVDSTVSDITPNPQVATVGIREYKISDGESAFSFRPSVVACQLEEYAKLESNSSQYDLFIIQENNQIIGKYDSVADTFAPISLNSIDVRSKNIASDGTDTEAILDTIIVRYNAVQEKMLRYFDIPDNVANIQGLREAFIDVIGYAAPTLTVDVRTKCEGVAVTGLADGDFITLDENGDIATNTVTEVGNGRYTIDITTAVSGQVGIDEVANFDTGVFSDLYDY